MRGEGRGRGWARGVERVGLRGGGQKMGGDLGPTGTLSLLTGSLFMTRCTKCQEIVENTESPICPALKDKGYVCWFLEWCFTMFLQQQKQECHIHVCRLHGN